MVQLGGVIRRQDRKPTRGREAVRTDSSYHRTAARKHWRSWVWAAVVAAGLPFLGGAAWAQGQAAADPNAPALRLIKLIPINGTAANRSTRMFSFDISWVDPTTGLYFLADRSNAALDVVDTNTDTLFGQIGGPSVGFAGDTGSTATSGPNGVTVAPNLPCIFATDTAATGGGRVVSFNSSVSFTTLVSSVNTGGTARADEMAFDPLDRVILAINNADTPPFATLISVSATCQLTLGTKILLNAANHVNATNGAEQPVWVGGSTQRFFLSVPQFDGVASRGGVVQITARGVIEGIYQVNFCSPAGLTVGPNGDLLVGCNTIFDLSGNTCTAVVPAPGTSAAPATCTGIANPQAAICNPSRGCSPATGSLLSVPGVGGGDEVWFNSGDQNYYVTGGNDPVGPVFGVVASGANTLVTPNTLTQLVPTLPPVPAVTTGTNRHSAGTVHSIAASAANNHVYVPLPANTSYQLNGVGCAQGCIAVFSAQ
jgi:hypothetical protein